MKKVRIGDQVVVIAGNDKGKTGKVLRFKGDRVIIEGINIRKKHQKKTQENQEAQIIDIECPINISNVQPFVGEKGVKLKVQFKDGVKRLVHGKKNVLFREIKKQVKS
ncbi:MAG: hypothetical protein S4CHLAM45_12920 [Chlamydiales bacterium]|nr:hypothetical protein [Chlamydiales bacterium]MCH9619781.1 hypothetical protein [Chlamydiales bacterium]MCH9623387.1 hypothetical protein [Chlamydiales bacterium]